MDKLNIIEQKEFDIFENLLKNNLEESKEEQFDEFGQRIEEDDDRETKLYDLKDIKETIADSGILGEKVIVDGKPQKKIALVNDYRDFYYLNEGRKKEQKLYHYVSKCQVTNRNFNSFKLDTLIPTKRYKNNSKSLEENINFLKLAEEKDKSIILLSPTRGGFYAMYKGIIGFISTDAAYKATLESLSITNILFPSETSLKSNPIIKNAHMNIVFPTIKNNFSKGKKRKLNFTEINITFKEKEYENSRKVSQTNNNNKPRV